MIGLGLRTYRNAVIRKAQPMTAVDIHAGLLSDVHHVTNTIIHVREPTVILVR